MTGETNDIVQVLLHFSSFVHYFQQHSFKTWTFSFSLCFLKSTPHVFFTSMLELRVVNTLVLCEKINFQTFWNIFIHVFSGFFLKSQNHDAENAKKTKIVFFFLAQIVFRKSIFSKDRSQSMTLESSQIWAKKHLRDIKNIFREKKDLPPPPQKKKKKKNKCFSETILFVHKIKMNRYQRGRYFVRYCSARRSLQIYLVV